MKFEYVGIFMPKTKGRDYEEENNMYGTCHSDVAIINGIGNCTTLVAQ